MATLLAFTTFLSTISTICASPLVSAASLAPRDDPPYDDHWCALSDWSSMESYWWSNGTDGTYTKCSAQCFAQPECYSFSVGLGECNLYTGSVASGLVYGISPYYFWDRNCEKNKQVCGKASYDFHFQGYWYSNTGTISDCYNECKRQSDTCRSYAYGLGECNLYEVPTAGNIFDYNGKSQYYFYDIACPSPQSSSATTTITSTKASTKASTTGVPTSTKSTGASSTTKTTPKSTTVTATLTPGAPKSSTTTPKSSTTRTAITSSSTGGATVSRPTITTTGGANTSSLVSNITKSSSKTTSMPTSTVETSTMVSMEPTSTPIYICS